MSKDKKEHYLAGYTYEEWEKLEKEFLNDYEKSTVYNKSFGELISEGWRRSRKPFAQRCWLSITQQRTNKEMLGNIRVCAMFRMWHKLHKRS